MKKTFNDGRKDLYLQL